MVAKDDHATSNHARTIYHQFSGTNLEDDSVPSGNEPAEHDSLEASSQRHKMTRSDGSKSAARIGFTLRTTAENVATKIIRDKMGELAESIN